MSAELEQSPNDAVVLCQQAAAGAGSSSAAAGREAVPPLAQARRAAVTLLRLQGQLLLEAKRMDEVRAGSRRVKGPRISSCKVQGLGFRLHAGALLCGAGTGKACCSYQLAPIMRSPL